MVYTAHNYRMHMQYRKFGHTKLGMFADYNITTTGKTCMPNNLKQCQPLLKQYP